ncbi:MAG: hypothetical protein GC208_09730 [Alphaproteobacteria bacterium]|nr:hypothetical protein [Alphaproteobacteria bacterium]
MGTKAGAKLYVAEELQDDTDLNQAGFEALTWVLVKDVGTFPEYGRNEATATYDAFSGIVKGKGSNNAGDGDFIMAYDPTDAGQVQMRSRGAQRRNVCFKIEHADATGTANGDKTATMDYLRGVLSGPRSPAGGTSDFEREAYSFGNNQHLRVLPATISI